MKQYYRRDFLRLASVGAAGAVLTFPSVGSQGLPVSQSSAEKSAAPAFQALEKNSTHGPTGKTASVVSAASLRGKIMCGYQGWFRCPGDAANFGWVHWSRNAKRITPESLTFELWPDVRELGKDERFPAPGFTYPDGSQAELFSSDNAKTVRRHFEWMRNYNIDGAWLQHFVVGLPGARFEMHYPSHHRVLSYVADSAEQTGRVWALSFDIAGMPLSNELIFDVLTAEWKRLVDARIIAGPRYLHERGLPVVQIWGFYHQNTHNPMTVELAEKLIAFFKEPGPYAAFLIGGGDWSWRRWSDPAWQKFVRKFDAYSPWNVGNYSNDVNGDKHATTNYWADDKRECEKNDVFWLPVVYPGFGWNNLMRLSADTKSSIPRRGGQFLWEQFHALSKLGVDSVYVAMFDEMDEGTAILKITNTPPTQSHFVGYDGFPSNWYLRLVGEGGRMLKQGIPIPEKIPINP